MATNKFDPTKYGATPFDPTALGATPFRYDPRNDSEVQGLVKEGKKAEKFLGQNKAQQISQAFVRTIPKDITDFAIRGPSRLAVSAAEAITQPFTSGTKALGTKYKIPVVGEIQSFQSQAQEAIDRGSKPFGFKALVQPSLEAGASALESTALLRGTVKTAETGVKLVTKLGISKATKKALEQTTSSLSAGEKADASVRTLTGSKARGVKVVPNKRNIEVAEVAKPYISNNIVKTENNIKKGISDISTKKIIPALEKYSKDFPPIKGYKLTPDYLNNRLSDVVGGSLPGGLNKTHPAIAEKILRVVDKSDEINSVDDLEKVIRSSLTKAEEAIANKDILRTLNDMRHTQSLLRETQPTAKLIDKIGEIKPTLLTKNDPIRRGVYEDFSNRIVQSVANAKNDKELFKARQILDDLADAETNGKIWEDSGRLNPIFEVWRSARREINSFLGERVPELSDNLKTQSYLYDALEGVAEKTGKLIGKTGSFKKTLKGLGKLGIGAGLGIGGYAGIRSLIDK